MALRDIFNSIVAAANALQPAGTSAVTPNPANAGAGTITVDASSIVVGHFNAVINVTRSGAPGTAQGQISLDAGNNFDATVSFPSGASLEVGLPSFSPGLASPGLSGLALNFSGSFVAGDSYSLQALPQIQFLFGAEQISSQDFQIPTVIFVPTDSSFSGSEDYALGADQRTQKRAIMTDAASFDVHCWGVDYDRAELLRDIVLNAIHFSAQATKRIDQGRWENGEKMDRAGCLYVFRWTVQKPVLVQQAQPDVTVVQPPFTEGTVTTEVDSQIGGDSPLPAEFPFTT